MARANPSLPTYNTILDQRAECAWLWEKEDMLGWNCPEESTCNEPSARKTGNGESGMAEKTIFKRILDREIPATIVYEDEQCVAFQDIDPKAPVHLLIIPRKEIRSLKDVEETDAPLLGHLLMVCRKMAEKFGLENGFRTVINTGADGGQTVDHLHLHLLGQRALDWPPG